MGRIFQRAVELGRKKWRAGATVLYRGKVELVETTEEEVWTTLKRMKGRAPGIDEVCT